MRIVMGLFQSRGVAEDANNRLGSLGVPPDQRSVVVLNEIGPAPATMQPELEALQLDPLVLGNARQTFARFIRNGETAVFVHAPTDARLRQAVDTLWQYAPIAVEIAEEAVPRDPPADRR